jgi:RNA-directed DNA polymerase
MISMHATNKPFSIDKRLVYEAYKAVKSNRGAAGVYEQTIEQFDADLSGNLYRIWNRMSSGSYFPPPVRAVSIPKKSGGERILGVPTVADRVAQMVVKSVIESILDPIFLADSYGYRPNKSALDAVGVTRERCWKYDWVLEFDIKGLFDNIDHELLLRAVRKHITCSGPCYTSKDGSGLRWCWKMGPRKSEAAVRRKAVWSRPVHKSKLWPSEGG